MTTSNDQLQLIEMLLNLPALRVTGVEITEKEMDIRVELRADYSICHGCGQKATIPHGQGEKLRLRHLPVFNRKVFLQLQTRRYACEHCDNKTTTTQREDWFDPHSGMTRAFAQFLLRELVGSTIQDVSLKHDVSYDFVRGALRRYVRGEVNWDDFTNLLILGLDEISLLKGHGHFVTLVSARNKAGEIEILAVLEGREKETVKDFLKTIPEKLRATVREVCTDLYEGFVNAVKEALPHAKVVADRFHVAKLYREAADEVRKTELREIRAILQKEFPGDLEHIEGLMQIWRKNRKDLTLEERQKLDQILACSPLLRTVYWQRERLTGIFETKHTKESGEAAIRNWIASVRRTKLGYYNKFIGTLEKYMDEITNYFVSRLTSGWVEGLNNKVKVLKRRCYGIRVLPNLFRRIWLDLRGYEAFA
jgi:transposase